VVIEHYLWPLIYRGADSVDPGGLGSWSWWGTPPDTRCSGAGGDGRGLHPTHSVRQALMNDLQYRSEVPDARDLTTAARRAGSPPSRRTRRLRAAVEVDDHQLDTPYRPAVDRAPGGAPRRRQPRQRLRPVKLGSPSRADHQDLRRGALGANCRLRRSDRGVARAARAAPPALGVAARGRSGPMTWPGRYSTPNWGVASRSAGRFLRLHGRHHTAHIPGLRYRWEGDRMIPAETSRHSAMVAGTTPS